MAFPDYPINGKISRVLVPTVGGGAEIEVPTGLVRVSGITLTATWSVTSSHDDNSEYPRYLDRSFGGYKFGLTATDVEGGRELTRYGYLSEILVEADDGEAPGAIFPAGKIWFWIRGVWLTSDVFDFAWRGLTGIRFSGTATQVWIGDGIVPPERLEGDLSIRAPLSATNQRDDGDTANRVQTRGLSELAPGVPPVPD